MGITGVKRPGIRRQTFQSRPPRCFRADCQPLATASLFDHIGLRRPSKEIIMNEHSGPGPETGEPLFTEIGDALRNEGFIYRTGADMQPAFMSCTKTDWLKFAQSWDRLGRDRYMADGGRYRRRRYATFALSASGVTLKQHQPHYQSRDYNTLNGGVQRWFSPIEACIRGNPILLTVLNHLYALATHLTPLNERPDTWHAEVHQFRIEVSEQEAGNPTPEGLHRDGVDWVWVLMVARQNVSAGETSIHDLSKKEIGRFTLSNPMDSAFVDDHRVYHGVTPIQRLDTHAPGHRDVLVVTVRRA